MVKSYLNYQNLLKMGYKMGLEIGLAFLILRGIEACRHVPESPEPTPISVEKTDSCGLKTISFSRDIDPIFKTNCVSGVCHNNTNGQRGIGLDGYDFVSAYMRVDSTRILGAIRHKPNYYAMPLGRPKLDSCSILKIAAWVQLGLPNN